MMGTPSIKEPALPELTSATPSPELLLDHATEFTFYPSGAASEDMDAHHFAIQVSRRSEGRFAIVHGSQCWNGTTWEYESLPSHRTEEFIASTRFDRDDAVRQALELVDAIKINGFTWRQWLEHFAANE